MNISLITPAVLEPIDLASLKMHLRVDSGTLDGNLILTQSLAYGSHAVANNYTTHVGIGIDVLGKQAEVLLHCGTNGTTGTNDTRIEESDQLATGYTAWTGGAFTQITIANDNADYKKQYTGSKQYIRTASKVLLAACEFGTSILVNAATTAEDDLLTAIIQASREYVEDVTRRQLLTATWEYYLDEWPEENFIRIPFGNLQAVNIVSYKESDWAGGAEIVLTEDIDYIVELNGEGCGRIVLLYGGSWPSGTLFPSNPITIKFNCGWAIAADVPSKIKSAIKLLAADLYESRGESILGQTVSENKTAERLLASCRLWDEFK